jgi:hypothetical protein
VAAEKKGFNWRAFVSLYIVVSGLFITLTGLVLYLSPAGRVAHWVDWRLLGMTKEQWQAVHTIFSFIFVIAAILHLYFNWAIFWSYLKHRLYEGIRLKREVTGSVVLSLALFGFTLVEAPPFGWVMDLGTWLTDSWATEANEPPVPHAEELTLPAYAAVADIDLERVIAHLTTEGYGDVDTTLTLGELATARGTTPKELAGLLEDLRPGAAGGGATPGYGWMPVAEVCEREGVPLEVGLERLEKAGFTSDGSERLRDLAEAQGRRATELVAILRGGG